MSDPLYFATGCLRGTYETGARTVVLLLDVFSGGRVGTDCDIGCGAHADAYAGWKVVRGCASRRVVSFSPRYGYLWWLHDQPRGFAALGYLDTNIHVFPELELVAVRMQSRPKEGMVEPMYVGPALKLFDRIVPVGIRKR